MTPGEPWWKQLHSSPNPDVLGLPSLEAQLSPEDLLVLGNLIIPEGKEANKIKGKPHNQDVHTMRDFCFCFEDGRLKSTKVSAQPKVLQQGSFQE